MPARSLPTSTERSDSDRRVDGASAAHGQPGAAGLGSLAELDRELNRLQRTIRLAIQAQLEPLVGQSYATLEQNQQLAETIHRLLDSHGLRVQCSECGHPAILRVSPRAGMAEGAFVFDHTIDGRRTFHGGRAVLPEIRLVAKPPRKKPAAGQKSTKSPAARSKKSPAA